MFVLSWEELVSSGLPHSLIHGASPLGCAATIGVFDGVHLGHRQLLTAVRAQETAFSTVVTFSQNPKATTRSTSYGGVLSTLDQKLESFAGEGIDLVILIDFSNNFSRMSGKEFIGLLKDRARLQYLAVGQDFRCGYRLDTDVNGLVRLSAELDFSVDVIPPFTEGGRVVSSTRIRAAVAAGRLVEARSLLGRNYELDVRAAPITPGSEEPEIVVHSTKQVLPPPGRYDAVFRNDSDEVSSFTDVGVGTFAFASQLDANAIAFLPAEPHEARH